MRMKVFTAASMAQAMDLVRRELGEDAIIVASHTTASGGVRLTAALEDSSAVAGALEFVDEEVPARADAVDEVRQALLSHGTPAATIERLVGVLPPDTSTGAREAMAGACAAAYRFAALGRDDSPRPWIFVGTPGSGKTLAVAKFATQVRRRGEVPRIVTADTRRAGGVEQLRALTRILGVDLATAMSPRQLEGAVATADHSVFIDTPGVNPFDPRDMETLAELIAAGRGEAVLVMAAGADALEAVDTAAAFASLGVGRLLATRLDMVRRLGGMLAAADAGHLTFAEVSVSHHVADGLVAIDAETLARLILPHAAETAAEAQPKEAVR